MSKVFIQHMVFLTLLGKESPLQETEKRLKLREKQKNGERERDRER